MRIDFFGKSIGKWTTRVAVSGAALATTALATIVLATTAPPAATELPPLIPRAVLFGNPIEMGHQISPDGSQLSYVAPSDANVLNVWVKPVSGGAARMVTDNRTRGIFFYAWAPAGQHLLYFQDTAGDEDWHLFSVDLTTGLERDLTPFRGIRAQNLMTDADHPEELLVGLNLRDRRLFDMYRIHLGTGAVLPEAENPGDVLSWVADEDFVVRAATAFDPKDGRTIVRVRDSAADPWRDLVVIPFDDAHLAGQVNGGSVVIGFADRGRALNIASALGAETTRLVKVDAQTGAELAVLAADPRADLSVEGGAGDLRLAVLTHPTTGEVQAAIFEHALPEYRCIDPEFARSIEQLRSLHAGLPAILSRDRADQRWVVLFFDDDAAFDYYLFDRPSGEATFLACDNPALKEYTLAEKTPVTIPARDGLEMVGYLSLPPGLRPEKLPLVLYVHGGPWWRDSWGLDPLVQLLANRGYAVLQVNYRGSIGFGKRFLNAGNGEFGRGMHDDLVDAVRWAIDQGVADPGRVAIMGGSYGGYATLCGLTFTPELFACGVDIVGPSNMRTLLESFPEYSRPVRLRWIRRMGDVVNDDELNRRISPLFHVDRISAPLLIGHGVNDPRVKVAESDRIVEAMRARGLAVTYIVYPDEGHGFARAENNLDFTGRTEEFLGRILGGRVEPWTPVEGSTAEVR